MNVILNWIHQRRKKPMKEYTFPLEIEHMVSVYLESHKYYKHTMILFKSYTDCHCNDDKCNNRPVHYMIVPDEDLEDALIDDKMRLCAMNYRCGAHIYLNINRL